MFVRFQIDNAVTHSRSIFCWARISNLEATALTAVATRARKIVVMCAVVAGRPLLRQQSGAAGFDREGSNRSSPDHQVILRAADPPGITCPLGETGRLP